MSEQIFTPSEVKIIEMLVSIQAAQMLVPTSSMPLNFSSCSLNPPVEPVVLVDPLTELTVLGQ